MSMYNSCFSEPIRSHAVPGDDQAVDDKAEEEPAGAPDLEEEPASACAPDLEEEPAGAVGPSEDDEVWGLWTGDLTNWGRRAFFVDRLKMNARISIYLDRYCR